MFKPQINLYYINLQVQTNGIIGFMAPVNNSIPMHLNEINGTGNFMAVFWAHSDISRIGTVLFYFANNTYRSAEFFEARSYINVAFPNFFFVPEFVLIMSWEDIGYWESNIDKVKLYEN